MLNQLSWPTLQTRRKLFRLQTLHKVFLPTDITYNRLAKISTTCNVFFVSLKQRILILSLIQQTIYNNDAL